MTHRKMLFKPKEEKKLRIKKTISKFKKTYLQMNELFMTLPHLGKNCGGAKI